MPIGFDEVQVNLTEAAGPPVTTGLFSQYDAQSLTGFSDGDSVGTWPDEESGAGDASNSTSSEQPTYQTSGINTNAALDFLRSDTEHLETTYSPSATEFDGGTVFIVFESDTTGTDGMMCGAWDNPRFYFEARDDGSMQVGWGDNFAGFSSYTAGESIILTVQHPGGDSADVDCWKNGGNNSTIMSSTFSGTNSNNLHIGNVDGDPQNLDGRVGEILLYTSVLSSTERGEVESYLSDRWGITLA